MEEGAPVEPPIPLLALIIEDLKRKEIDPIVEQVIRNFLEDEEIFKSRAFIQFLWRNNMNFFEARYKKTF